jgi:hypothetical protein
MLQIFIVIKKFNCFLNGHIQNLGYVFAMVFNLKTFLRKSKTFAYGTYCFDIRHKLQVCHNDAVAGAVFASCSVGMSQAEIDRIIAMGNSLVRRGEKISDLVVNSDIGGGVGFAAASDGRLVDVDNLIYRIIAQQKIMIAGYDTGRLFQYFQLFKQSLVY